MTGGKAYWPLGAGRPTIAADVIRLTPKGRRAIGQWPFGDTGELLLRALEDATQRLPEGETKSRMRSLLKIAREIGTNVLTGVMTNVIKGSMGPPRAHRQPAGTIISGRH
ncbi:MAG: hypothetical protein ACYDGN_10500 [Acidimicrobiales bacterium]